MEINEPLCRECHAFLQAVVARTSPLTDGLSGLQVFKVLEAAQRSLIMNGAGCGDGEWVFSDKSCNSWQASRLTRQWGPQPQR